MLEAQTISSACAHTSQSAISFTCSINIASFHLRSLSACSLTSTGAVHWVIWTLTGQDLLVYSLTPNCDFASKKNGLKLFFFPSVKNDFIKMTSCYSAGLLPLCIQSCWLALQLKIGFYCSVLLLLLPSQENGSWIVFLGLHPQHCFLNSYHCCLPANLLNAVGVARVWGRAAVGCSARAEQKGRMWQGHWNVNFILGVELMV